MSDVFHICERCREIVDPGGQGIVRAVELHRVATFEADETIDGLGVFFHAGCYPTGSSRYRRA